MASIDTGTTHRRRSISGELPLVPFVDLLLCCVMFLLVTAVWNQLGSLHAQATGPGPTADTLAVAPPLQLMVEVHHDGYRITGNAGEETDIPARQGALDQAGLEQALTAFRTVAGTTQPVVLLPDDDVHHGDVVATMDTLVGAGYSAIRMGSGWGS